MRRIVLIVFCLLLPTPAMAHVVANPNHAEAGQYAEISFRIAHGCDGKPTTGIAVTLPKGLTVATPQFKNGWRVEVRTGAPIKAAQEGHDMEGGPEVNEILWSGGVLPPNLFDTFTVLIKLPDTAGQTLWFPVEQTCQDTTVRWDQIPATGQEWHDVKTPAPFVKLDAGMAMPMEGMPHH